MPNVSVSFDPSSGISLSPSNGQVTMRQTGEIIFQPAPNQSGWTFWLFAMQNTDAFNWLVTDDSISVSDLDVESATYAYALAIKDSSGGIHWTDPEIINYKPGS
ncbi:MAG: hypothetical protein PVI01_08030 [Gemmatimonadales bacterium]|jgi:hypothetical protein